MQAETHRELTRLVIERVEKKLPQWNLSDRERLEILKGSVKPDRSLDVFLLPHYYVKSGREILRRIEEYISEKPCKGMLEAGYVLHYLTDYSSKVHRAKGLVRPADHIRYEKKLDDFFKSYRIELKMTEVKIPPPEELIFELKSQIELYQVAASSMNLDLETAFSVCVKTLFHIVRFKYNFSHIRK